ncbi:HprK-related kinase B [Gilvimarinus sp. DA14]|uniref:HprK-related kinase B n=1 Tax=Gilvimarinus sp. DA14 TaxID=2956798 RepID=UPI0020B8A097|nr:HprK-related kinase B [Gilvimarinus sp. DA14]UTF59903.1 HprK-related kinase B [Gilvimarinus sp. DA14]
MAEAKANTETEIHNFLHWLQRHPEKTEYSLSLALPGASVQVNCTQAQTASSLKAYFQPWLMSGEKNCDATVTVIESPTVAEYLPWQEWQREPGKSARKDTFIDLDDARLLRKCRTGMVFLQSRNQRIAIGPCNDNLNQVINFINNQAMNQLQQNGWLIGHAAAASYNQQAIAIAGFSGGGKSTSMLRLLDHPKVNFVSNDRIFTKQVGEQLLLCGAAKMPRVNPGTLLNNPRLQPLLTAEQKRRYQTMAPDELWELEEKYDVLIPKLYGRGENTRIENTAPLKAIVLLNWNRREQCATRIDKIDINERQELLPALMKSSGPFYQRSDGQFQPNAQMPALQAYLQQLSHTQVYAVSGGVDFSALRDFCWQLWQLPEAQD